MEMCLTLVLSGDLIKYKLQKEDIDEASASECKSEIREQTTTEMGKLRAGRRCPGGRLKHTNYV